MDIILTLVIGGIVGWTASLLTGANGHTGMAASVLVGVVGSVLGPWLAGLLGLALAASPARWLVSMLGAAVLIALVSGLRRVRLRELWRA